MRLKTVSLTSSLLCVSLLGACGGGTTTKEDAGDSAQLPDKFANDPVAKLVGASVFSAALAEGSVDWYGGDVDEAFIDAGMGEVFEERFGIKVNFTFGGQAELTDRIMTEHATGNVKSDVVHLNDVYMYQFLEADVLEEWTTKAPTLKDFSEDVFSEGVGASYMTPMNLSVLGLLVNTDMIPPSEVPTSYEDLLDPKWNGKVLMRDPRTASGAAWQFLQIRDNPALGLGYIQQLHDTVDPFVCECKSSASRDAIITGRFAIEIGGRPESVVEAPEGSPITFVGPEEGLTYGATYVAVVDGSDAPNAAKVLATWLYEPDSLQVINDYGRPLPYPNVTAPFPEADLSRYTLMPKTREENLINPGPFFEEMKEMFGSA